MKKGIVLLLVLVLLVSFLSAGAEGPAGWTDMQNQDEAVRNATEYYLHESGEQSGLEDVSPDIPDAPTRQEKAIYSFTPLDAVLIIDVSGSMDRTDRATGKSLLTYAKLAADSFASTLYSINPASRIGIVAFSDDASRKTGLLGQAEEDRLKAAVDGLNTEGTTNNGDGFRKAAALLNDQGSDRRRMVIMLTDGQANRGGNDPVQYAIEQGTVCAGMGYVYTIGMVGGMDSSEKAETRRALNAGYETRYFELDFASVADAGSMITMLTSSIAYAASSAESSLDAGNVVIRDIYQLSLGSGFIFRIRNAEGKVLSDFPGEVNSGADFGTLVRVDDNKHISLFDGDYEIDIRGSGNGQSTFSLQKIHGADMQQTPLTGFSGWNHESVGKHITLTGGAARVTDNGYNCTDPTAKDWNGNPVTGLQNAPEAAVNSVTPVLGAPLPGAASAGMLAAGGRIWILAETEDHQYYFISYVDDTGALCRGWIYQMAVAGAPGGFVPVLCWLNGDGQAAAETDARRDPDASSAIAFRIPAGSPVRILHCERDAGGAVWAYVTVTGGNPVQYGYVPSSAVAGFDTDVPAGFALGHNINEQTGTIRFSRVSMDRGYKLRVFSYPATSAWRGAKGKAVASTNGEVRAAGWVGNWLLIEYDTTNGSVRVGYTPAEDVPRGIQGISSVLLRAVPATIIYGCTLTDDPVRGTERITDLRPGTQVTYLSAYVDSYGNSSMAYIETTVGNQPARGFVPLYCVQQD